MGFPTIWCMRLPFVHLGLVLTALTGAPVLALEAAPLSIAASGPTPDAKVQAKLDLADRFIRRV